MRSTMRLSLSISLRCTVLDMSFKRLSACRSLCAIIAVISDMRFSDRHLIVAIDVSSLPWLMRPSIFISFNSILSSFTSFTKTYSRWTRLLFSWASLELICFNCTILHPKSSFMALVSLMPLVTVELEVAMLSEPECWDVTVRSSCSALGPNNGGVVKDYFLRFNCFLVFRFPSRLSEAVTVMSASAFLQVLNTGTPEPSGSASMLNFGVISPKVIPTFMFSTHSLMSELIACSLFQFGQSPKAITEASRGGQTLSRFMGVSFARSALSTEAREYFGWLEYAICKFCSALDTLSDMMSKNMLAIISPKETFRIVYWASTTLLQNSRMAWWHENY